MTTLLCIECEIPLAQLNITSHGPKGAYLIAYCSNCFPFGVDRNGVPLESISVTMVGKHERQETVNEKLDRILASKKDIRWQEFLKTNGL